MNSGFDQGQRFQAQYGRNNRNKGAYYNQGQTNEQQYNQGNQRYNNSPTKQGQQQNKFNSQNFNNNYNQTNYNERGISQNRNFKDPNQKFNQGGQRNQRQQNQGFDNQQNSRSRSSNQRNQGNGIDRDWQQSKVQQRSSNFVNDNNYGSNNQQKQNYNRNQQNRQESFATNNANNNFNQNKKFQQNFKNNQFANMKGIAYRPPPQPVRSQNVVNQTNKPKNNAQKKPYVNKQMKNFINDKEVDSQHDSSNQEEDIDEQEDEYTESQDVKEDYEQSEDDQEGKSYDSQSNDQQDENDDNEDEQEANEDEDEDSYQNNQDEDEDGSQDIDNPSESDNQESSGYDEVKHNQRKGPVRELVIRRAGMQQEFVADSSSQQIVTQNFALTNSDGDQMTIAEQAKNLSSMCHESIDDASWEWHLMNRPQAFAFFEKNKKGQPQKNLAMKVYYRSAAAKELVMSNILSPIGIKKSADRMINEILDYFLQPKINVKELVDKFTDRLRTLIAELEPLSQHLSLYNSTKMMIEIKELLLVVNLAGINYFRKQSCLKDYELENGYNEKKLFEQVQTLSDNLIMTYEQNIVKIQSIIEKSKNVDMQTLKKQILQNESIYLSPLIPKVISWRLLLRLDDLTSLHKMDDLLNIAYDSLIIDESFCAIFELITWLTKKNYFKYFEMLNKDKRIDYLSANACLLRLSNVRLSYIIQEKFITRYTLQNLQFDLDSQYDKDSAQHFLGKLGCDVENIDDLDKVKIDPNRSYLISLAQLYWPNFYEKIEWRKPNSFKDTIRKILGDSDMNRFPEILVENMIKKDRKIQIVTQQPPVKQVVSIREPQIQPQPKEDKKKIPVLNLPINKYKPNIVVQEVEKIEEQKQKVQFNNEQLQRQISAEEEKKAKEEQMRNKLIQRWEKLIKSKQSQIVNELIQIVEYNNQLEFQESYLCLKFFQKWKNYYKYEKYKNQQIICHGINNPPIVIKKSTVFSKPAPMEIEQDKKHQQKDQNAFYQNFLKAFNEKEKQIGQETHNFLDMISINFLKEKNKMFTHFYYKITIISDEQNPLIENMVSSLSNYLSQGKNTDCSFSITIQIEDITIEYTLQLQMAKYLDRINTKQLSGTDLFIYIFTEQDDELNQQYYRHFKKHLEALSKNKFSLGFNLLFLSVNEFSKLNQSNFSTKQYEFAASSSSNKLSNHLFESPSQGLYLQNMNRSMSSHTAYQMMLDMNYTNPEVQDSEGFVRSAIKYLNKRFDLKKDVEQNSIYQYYNVISYTYENINGKCINKDPFSDRIFKASIDSAIEKSIHVKSPFGKITFTSLSIELQKIRQILAFGKDVNYSSSSKQIPGLPPLPPNSSGRNLYKQLKEFLIREQVLDVKKYPDMKNYFYFKYLFNNTIYQLFENFLSIMEQSHLIPFDQLNEFQQNQLILLEQTLEIVKEQLDKIFIRDSNKSLKQYIRKNYFTSFTYENVVQTVDSYYKNLLEISSEFDSDFDNETTVDSIDSNQDAYQSLVNEMVEVIKNNFNFSQKTDNGVVGNWQAVFIKLLDQLISIFQENDIPMFLSQNFQFKFDCKLIKKNIQEEYQKLCQWLKDLKQTNESYLNQTTQIIGDYNQFENQKGNPNKKLKKEYDQNQSTFNDQQYVVRLYSEIIQYNQEHLLNKSYQKTLEKEDYQNQQAQGKIDQLKQSKQKNEVKNLNEYQNQQIKNDKLQNQVLKNEKQSSLSYSQSDYSSPNSGDEEIEEISSESQECKQNQMQSESNSESDFSEEEKPIQNKNLNKRRTACLVPNKKDEINDEVQYGEKIKKLMRGEIENSPTHLDDSFV
ncbi:hypothetical protein TTHERM_00267870 (macronuclear) [Tetrahymena thermophila SB210]|uniref:Uncharacterized protein n=1 Tax=Tetrahymena thermophila (strain SB210) TaxID=312017 RepID=I7M182_TETTS|nr:hypothetical protein TTHERM_00267870 [Tetrahymena thermophila SB210]EAR95677.2 hypothetical protein TTHERM_00267870 [Tetrahymena thermophila SB210]|eukprot:XP_001015922.2 hypothetical protein TTHERM_00267870 [Tetrahymena thermophila SB210]